EMLHEEAVLVPAALPPDGRDAGDVQAQRPGRLRDRLGAGRLAGQSGWLDGERLAALEAPDRDAEMLLGDLAGRDAVGAMGTDRHGGALAMSQMREAPNPAPLKGPRPRGTTEQHKPTPLAGPGPCAASVGYKGRLPGPGWRFPLKQQDSRESRVVR